MTLDSQNSVYSVLVSSASNGLKYNLTKSVANHPRNIPHLFTLTFKLGNKAPVHISPVHVWFGAGTIKISSFVCLVGIGLGIGTYAVYKIYKKVFPIGVGSLPTFMKKSNREAAKVDKIKINVSSTSNDNGRDNDDEISGICRRYSQNSERHCRRRKVARPKLATLSTDSDTELNGLKSGSPINTKPPRILRQSSDLGFISMKSSQLLPQHQTSEDKSSTNLGLKSSYNLVDDHRGKRFVITPINAEEEEEAGLQLVLDHPLRCTSVTGHRRKQSTPDDLDGNLLDLSEFISEDQTRRSSGRSCPTDSKESGSDSDRTGMSLSQPSSEMFETARDMVLSGTLTEMEQLQSQLDLLSNDVDDLNCEMESLQKREDPVETVSRRYTLGAEEALTANKNKLRDMSSKKINKNRSRFLRKLDFQNSLSIGNKTRSCDLLGSDRSEDGVIALVESADLALDGGSGFIDSLISNVCSELDRLSSEASSSYGIVRLPDVSDGSICNEQILENWSEPLPRNAANQTFVVKRQSVESEGAKRKKIDFDQTDDLYIDDELISPSSNRKKNSTVSFDMTSPDQFMVRPRSMGSSNDSHYKTPDRSFATNLASPWFDGRMNYFHHLVSRDGRMNLVNNNLNINLISELLFLSSGDGPLSPRTSDFLATCMESPDRASSNLDPKAIRKFMEKIGEAVINFGRSTVPLKKFSGKACSTPNDLTSNRGHLQIFQRAVEKLCEPFPYWVVKNLEEPTDVVEYVERTFCANTESHICLGYKQIVKLTGARHVCGVRKDNFCIIRAALCQSIISDKLKSFGRMFSKDREKFLRVFQGNEYLKSSSFSNRIPFNKGSEMDVLKSCFDLLLSVVISQEAIHSKVHDPTQREEELRSLLDGLFNGCPIVDMHLMEAVKMVMVVEAIELYKSFDSFPLQSKSLAWAIFSGKSTQNPEQLFKNRICAIGDIQVLNEVETSLLAHSLKIKLEILRPAQFLGHSDGFVSHYPDEGADDCEKVTLVQEVDNSFILLLQ